MNLANLFRELLSTATLSWNSSFSGILTFLGTLIVSVIIAQIFVRIFKSKLLGFLVASACSIWLYELVFIKGYSLVTILVAMVFFLTIFLILLIIGLAIFVKRLPIPLKL